ncbi:MAG: RDD family protein [Luteolibacter sp.]
MDIWIIRNGEKTGPIHDYEVRHKIEDGQLDPATPAWHEGLPAWLPLGEIDLFKREFQLAPPPSEPPALPGMPPNAPSGQPPLPQPSVLGRRFWARWLDLSLYSGIWWILMWASGRDILGTLSNAWVLFPRFIPWFVLEIFLIHYFGTTPGKWLLSLRVTNLDGTKLNLSDATRRSARIIFTGIGFGWGVLCLFCQLLSFFTTKRLGTPLWDHAGGHQVVPQPLRPTRVVTLVFLFVFAIILQMVVVMPYLVEAAAADSPELKELLEKNPIWHLPKRS